MKLSETPRENRVLTFSVEGEPRPQGSKAVGRAKGGRAYVYEAGADKLKPWRAAMKTEAEEVLKLIDWGGPYDGPVKVTATFNFLEVASDPNREYALKAHDLDKLQRALGDSLEAAGVVTNDSRIVWWDAVKFHNTWEGVSVTVQKLS